MIDKITEISEIGKGFFNCFNAATQKFQHVSLENLRSVFDVNSMFKD